MTNALSYPSVSPTAVTRWRELVWPREHGSWSFALEPLAFGLLAAPSAPGALLGGAVMAAFFARRPLQLAVLGPQRERRAAALGPLVVCALLAAGFVLGAVALGGTDWLGWLGPVTVAGGIFLYFDFRRAGRSAVAEVAGVAAFSLVPAALAALAGWGAVSALALALVMCGRSVPTVLYVRAYLRERKTGGRQIALALIAAGLAVAAGATLFRAGLAPRTAVGWLIVLAMRAAILLAWPRPQLRARTIGVIEAALGAFFVLAVAQAWRA